MFAAIGQLRLKGGKVVRIDYRRSKYSVTVSRDDPPVGNTVSERL